AGGAEGREEAVGDHALRRRAPRLPRRLSPELPGDAGEGRLATAPRLVPAERSCLMRFGLFGSAQARRGGPDVDSGAGFREFVEVMLKAWTSDRPWSHRGKYWQFDNVVVEPPTAQKPHPPLWMGAGRPQSIKKVAALGYNLLLDQFAPIEQIGDRIALYKTEV